MLKETHGKLSALYAKVREIFDAAGNELDFSKPEVLRLTGQPDSKSAVEHVRALNKELEDLRAEYERLRELKSIEERVRETLPKLPFPSGGEEKRRVSSFGELIVESPGFKAYLESRQPGKWVSEGWGLPELKANFVTTAGWEPESVRRPGLVIPPGLRPIQVLDVIPTAVTDQAVVKWMDHSTATEAAAERSEAGAYPEETHALTEKSSTVRSIGASIPVSDEQLEDVPAVRAYLDQVLMNSIRRRLDNQIIAGNGTAPNLLGLLNVTGILTQAKGADPVFDAIYKAIVQVNTTEFYNANVIFLHPNDWQDIRLTRTADGIYILGEPIRPDPNQLFGLPVVLTNALPENTGLVGDLNFCTLFERRGVEVEVGFVGTQFTSGMRTIRAGLRVAFATYRAKAFCKVTGI